MRKLIGSICVLGGGAWVYFTQRAQRLRQRDTLLDLIAVLELMGEEIRRVRTPLPLLLEALSKGHSPSVSAFLARTAKGLHKGEPLDALWRREVKTLPLPPEEIRVLCVLGVPLGGDEEQACKALALAAAQLSRHCEERAAVWRDQDRQAAAVCFSAAALLVILLI